MLDSSRVYRGDTVESYPDFRAIAYYRKHNWIDLGPRPSYPELHLMEIKIP